MEDDSLVPEVPGDRPQQDPPQGDSHENNASTDRPAEPIERILGPFQRFLKAQATSGILLLAVTAIALVWANSAWAESYHDLWHLKLKVGLAGFSLSESLHWWINDALMAAFFFLVGLEIKREILVGELSSPNKAALPLAAAIGGMVVPAVLFSVFNFGTDGQRGWGVPMATDIAFAIGVLALLGDRVPLSAKVFLTALAIVDDIGASMVIALFYTDDLSWWSLAVAGCFFLVMLIANRAGVRSPLMFFLLGLGVWFGFLTSGVHPTLSGIIGALAIPARVRINTGQFLRKSRGAIKVFEQAGLTGDNVLTNSRQRGALHSLEKAVHHAETPLQRLEHIMHPWVLFVIMPLFALANAGVSLSGDLASTLIDPVALGIIVGLVLGKPLGIVGFSWLAVRVGVATLPSGVSWRWITGLACLAGIGFTMSLFIAGLAFVDEAQLKTAKLAILSASLVAGVGGWLMLRQLTGRGEAGRLDRNMDVWLSPVLKIVFGLVSLIAGGELLVRGASKLAAAMKISPLVIGLTVVAFGTSSPELAVSVQSAWAGNADIAVGNVVGSNIFNVLFILGLSALIVPLAVSSRLIRWDVPLMIVASVLLLLLGLDGLIGRLDGLLLFSGLLAYTFWCVRQSRRESREVKAEFAQEIAVSQASRTALLVQIGFIIGGLVLLGLGSHWLVGGSVFVASRLGVSELIIGLTIIAAGTSLPEVVTSIMAAWRGERDIAVGNVVGSNLFNILCVLGLASAIAPNGVAISPAALQFDIPVMIAVAVACLPIFFTGNVIARWEGGLFFGYYIAYTTYLVLAVTQATITRAFGTIMIAFVIPLTVITLFIGVFRAARDRAKTPNTA